MKREIILSAAAFIMFAFVAGNSVAQNTLMSVTGTVGTLQVISPDGTVTDNVTDEECEAAWASSPAYGVCGSRLQVEGPAQEETVSALANICVIETSCEHYAAQNSDIDGVAKLTRTRSDTSWNGGVEAASKLQNCNGTLWFTKC